MKKLTTYIFSGVMFILSSGLFSQSVSYEWVQQIAQHFSTKKELTIDTVIQSESTQGLYLLRFKPHGFLLLSSDVNCKPVLVYSWDQDFVVPIQKETAVYEQIEKYSKQINYIRENKILNLPNQNQWHLLISGKHSLLENNAKDIAPLTTSNWHLSSPWNEDCPADPNGSGGHTKVGCLAVAMGQIMYYWQHPSQGSGYHEYSSGYGILSANFGNTTYHFDSMYDATSSPAATQLLYHCGVAVDMHYGPAISYAWSFAAIPAMADYFKYKDNNEMLHQSNYTDFEWNIILRNELDQLRPVYFQGFNQNATMGHGFICDGYQDNGYYHFNWGLGGNYNAYYYLYDLTPGNADFSYNQGIIRKIEPVFNFTHDLSIRKVLSPHSDNYLSNAEKLSIRIQNDGNLSENSFIIQAIINQQDTIQEFYSQSLPAGENIDYEFSTPVDLSNIANYIIRFEVILTQDEYPYNNVFTEPIVCSELNFCIPDYTQGCNEGDGIEGLQLLDFSPDNSGCSSLNANAYSQYLSIAPQTLTLDSIYSINIQSAHNNDYTSLWIDENDDAVFDTNEIVVNNLLLANAYTWYEGSIPIDRDMNPGKHAMRIRTRRDTLIDSSCGSFALGEAEDYFVNIRDYCQKPYQFVDEFESYTKGQYLACQNPKDWTTWSDAPCSSEDALISDEQAYSGSQSLLIIQGDDFVHPINNFNSGIYKVSFQMYIPSGKLAYFNTLLKFNGSGSAWGQEIRFQNGIAEMDAAGSNAAQFNYSFDQWFENKLIVNMDLDSAYFYYEDSLIYQWKWSYGAHDTDALNQLGGNNFWGWNGAKGDCYFFVDDYCVEHIFEKPEPINGLSFSYSQNYEHVVLQWEYPDSLQFVVFHSTDNITFQALDTVTSMQYVDSLVPIGKHYYYVKSLCQSNPSDKSNTLEVTISTRLNIHVFLEGAYDDQLYHLHKQLNIRHFIPSSQIFDSSPWYYPGEENLNHIPADMVDWILIKIYDTTQASLVSDACIVDTLCGLLLQDGSIVSLDGNSPLILSSGIEDSLFFQIFSRNHIPVINAVPPVFHGKLYEYDFTNSQDAAYLLMQNALSGGKYGMIAGDANADSIINDDDLIIWQTESGSEGYLRSDFNLDSQSDNADKNDYWEKNR
jgi:hypothetical protein